MQKKVTAEETITGGELKQFYEKAARGEQIRYNDELIDSLPAFRRVFASHPDLAALDGQESGASGSEGGVTDAERTAFLARAAELESHLVAQGKTVEALEAGSEAVKKERDDATKRAEKAEARVAELEKEVADLKAAVKSGK